MLFAPEWSLTNQFFLISFELYNECTHGNRLFLAVVGKKTPEAGETLILF